MHPALNIPIDCKLIRTVIQKVTFKVSNISIRQVDLKQIFPDYIPITELEGLPWRKEVQKYFTLSLLIMLWLPPMKSH